MKIQIYHNGIDYGLHGLAEAAMLLQSGKVPKESVGRREHEDYWVGLSVLLSQEEDMGNLRIPKPYIPPPTKLDHLRSLVIGLCFIWVGGLLLYSVFTGSVEKTAMVWGALALFVFGFKNLRTVKFEPPNWLVEVIGSFLGLIVACIIGGICIGIIILIYWLKHL